MNINLKPIDLLMNPNIEDLSYHVYVIKIALMKLQ